MQRVSGWGLMAVLLFASGCGGPNEPTPVADAPSVTCPANVTVTGVAGGSQAVPFALPTTVGGAVPVTVECTRAPGSEFTLGTTTVACSAVDRLGRQSQCSFTVSLAPQILSVTRFLAFGDSLTEGENGRFRSTAGFIDFPNLYPVKLELLLNTDYPDQNIVVVNSGRSGELAGDAASRLPRVLRDERPGALLLLDGYNDLLSGCPTSNAGSGSCASAIDEVVKKLRECVETAKDSGSGVRFVFVSTLTPPGPHLGGKDRRIDPQAIVRTNERLSQMAGAEGALLVDSYPLFVGHEQEYIDEDGLHLRPAGYDALAGAFFAAIKAAVPASSPAGMGLRW